MQEVLAELRAVRGELADLKLAVNRGRVKYEYPEAVRRLGFSERTLHRRIAEGRLRPVHEGGRSYITEDEAVRYEDAERLAARNRAA